MAAPGSLASGPLSHNWAQITTRKPDRASCNVVEVDPASFAELLHARHYRCSNTDVRRRHVSGDTHGLIWDFRQYCCRRSTFEFGDGARE